MDRTDIDILNYIKNRDYIPRMTTQVKNRNQQHLKLSERNLCKSIISQIKTFILSQLRIGATVYISSLGQFYCEKPLPGKIKKLDIIYNIVDIYKMDRKIAKMFVEDYFNCIAYYLTKDGSISISGIGTLYLQNIAVRTIQTFTGEKKTLHAQKRVLFTPSSKINDETEKIVFKFKSSATLRDVCNGYKSFSI